MGQEQNAVTNTTTNYMVPSNGNTHSVSDNPVLSASALIYDFRQFTLDSQPFRPQGIFIDNTANNAECVFTINGINYSQPIPPNASMTFNFPSPKGGAVISITGGGQVNLCFVDFPVMPQLSVMGVGGQGTPVTIPSTPPGAQAYVFQELPKSVDAHYAGLTAAGASAAIGPAVANTNLRLLKMSITGNASMAATGLQNIQAKLNGVLIYEVNVEIPNAAGTGPTLWSDTLEFDKLAPNAGTGNLTITLGTAFATGQLDVNAYYD